MYMENNYFIHLLPAVIPAQGRNYLVLGKYLLILSLFIWIQLQLCCVQTWNSNNGEHIWRELLMQKSHIFHPATGWEEKEQPNFTGTKAQLTEKIPELLKDNLGTKESKIVNLGISMKWCISSDCKSFSTMFSYSKISQFSEEILFSHFALPVLWGSKWHHPSPGNSGVAAVKFPLTNGIRGSPVAASPKK